MSKSGRGSTSQGAIIFIDVDRYLDVAGKLSLDNELSLISSLTGDVREAAKKRGFELARSFGDGFLLIRSGKPSTTALNSGLGLFCDVRDAFASRGFTLKGSFTAGPLVQAPLNLDGPGELVCGPAANFAGKLLARCPRQTLLLAWPESATSTTSSFEDLVRTIKYRSIPIDNVPRAWSTAWLSKTAPPVALIEQPISDFGPPLTFANEIKKYVLEMIKLADDKAKTVLALSAGALVYLFNYAVPRFDPSRLHLDPSLNVDWVFTSLVISMFNLAIAFVAGMGVILPRTATATNGLVFFGSISGRSSSSAYASEYGSKTTPELITESAAHNFEFSRVALKKYFYLRLSMIVMAIGFAFMLIYMGTGGYPQDGI
ncbi:MAG: hypothetical protein KKC29_08955 [Alphaproteobacteria bacterium]|jgi:hypothetical protein|nr:hypothetical protein [Alphaproteobacteria bacterium]MBU2041790.1 hypothetical protein [Alphaproteobacteria bacterium]MBU2126151.1 hypothetical protein [Alphaproteobacteria bacterium]MBU2291218.1 hypothetical protein [Alphaproteobacteria bacterium]